MRAVKASLFRLSSEPIVGIDGPVELDSPALFGIHSSTDNVLSEHPQVRELDRLAAGQWPYYQIDKQKRLKISSFWVVFELFDPTRDLYKLGLKVLKLTSVVLSVHSPLRRDGGEVAHGLIITQLLRFYCAKLLFE